MTKNSTILSTAYFPPIQYISKFLMFDSILIEAHENYSKQSYRNRCVILTANGKLNLTIPVKTGESAKCKTKDVIIDYDTNWQKLHFKAIESAYRSSPFFEYYIDNYLFVFEKKHTFLLDMNNQILENCLDDLGILPNFQLSKDYFTDMPDVNDYRDSIHPKTRMNKADNAFSPLNYMQVFSEKFAFMPNLSILDLIFNEGPNALEILKNSISI